MGKKKRNHPDIEEILGRPWCYYCERDFDDLKILINHQRAKHFMCERCGRRLNTAGGLSVHMNQVHKETLSQIDNALPNRAGLEIEIFGMEGIPDEIVAAHRQRVLSQFAQAEAERRAATGNSGPGGSGGAAGNAAKKPKFESPSEMKKRLAEHKAKKAADDAAGTASPVNGGPPQTEGNGTQSPAFGQPPGYPGAAPFTPGQQGPYVAPPGNLVYGAQPQPYGQPNAQFPPPQQPPFQAQPPVFNGQQQPPFGQPTFSPPQPYPTPGFTAPPFQASPPPQFANGPPPRPFNSNTPPAPFRVQTPPQGMQPAQRQNSLPSAPGLPQRPSFNAPNVNAAQMQQMHQGHHPNPSAGPNKTQASASPIPPQNASPQLPAAVQAVPTADVPAEVKPEGKPDAKTEEAPKEKKSKKDKDNIKLVYSDNDISPEEKMAKLPRYAFDPINKDQNISGNAIAASTATVAA